MIKSFLLYFATAFTEILGCYLPLLWLKKEAMHWVLIPAVISLVVFVWLLSLHPAASGRVYAAYGGIYVVSALIWLTVVDGIRPTLYDITGTIVVLIGAGIIMLGWRAVD